MSNDYKNMIDSAKYEVVLEKMKKYSEEIGLREVMTLDEMIDSHRSQRELVKESLRLSQDAYREYYGKWKSMMEENHEFVKIDDLKKMTLSEIIEFIGCDE